MVLARVVCGVEEDNFSVKASSTLAVHWNARLIEHLYVPS